MIKKILLGVTLCLILASSAWGRDWHVRPSGGNYGLEDGTSKDNAWDGFSNILWGPGGVQPGDTLYLHDDDGDYREELTVGASGSEDNSITIRTYGDSPATISGANVYNNNDWTNESGNIWYMNHSLGNWGTNTVVVIDGTRYFPVSAKNSLTTNTYYVDTSTSPDTLYVYSLDDPDNHTTEVSARLYGILIVRKQYITIENIKCQYNGYSGIRLANTQANGYCIVDDCELYHNRQFGVIIYDGHENNTVRDSVAYYNGNGFYAVSADNNTFENNHAHDNIHYTIATLTDGHGFGSYNSDGTIFAENESYNDYQEVCIDGGQNLTVRRNYLHDAQGGTNGITIGNLTGGTNKFIYNLLINNGGSSGWGFGIDAACAGNIYIYNNTIYNNGSTGNGGIYAIGGRLYIKNNIIRHEKSSGTGNALRFLSGVVSITSDYNNLYTAGANLVHNAGSNYATIDDWNTVSGQDANSISQDPLFTNASANNFTLQSNSRCIDRGTDVNLERDYAGNNVPFNGTPDIGAFEYIGDSVPPNAPTAFRIIGY